MTYVKGYIVHVVQTRRSSLRGTNRKVLLQLDEHYNHTYKFSHIHLAVEKKI
jgi:hypothetical protein